MLSPLDSTASLYPMAQNAVTQPLLNLRVEATARGGDARSRACFSEGRLCPWDGQVPEVSSPSVLFGGSWACSAWARSSLPVVKGRSATKSRRRRIKMCLSKPCKTTHTHSMCLTACLTYMHAEHMPHASAQLWHLWLDSSNKFYTDTG